MSKEAEEYLKDYVSENHLSSIYTRKELGGEIARIMQAFADQQIKERLNSVTEDDIDARGMVYLQCDKQAPLLRAFKLGYYECVNLLKKK